MGFTGLARWVNAPANGLQLIHENIISGLSGHFRGRWSLSMKSYRSTLGHTPGLQLPSERTMCALTMNENVFVLLEDPLAPTLEGFADVGIESDSIPMVHNPSHYRSTYLTLSPPGALEQLIDQLKSRWVSVRQPSNAPRSATSGNHLTIEGSVFTIGSDWVVRTGNVILAGGAVRGMLLEAEYLPLPALHGPLPDGTFELISDLLTSVLPNLPNAKIVAVTISDSQWDEVLWDREEEEERKRQMQDAKEETKMDIEEDIYAYEDEVPHQPQKGEWYGMERDRRAAFLIIGALKSESIL